MKLVITEPIRLILDQDGIVSVRAEDASGGFGILEGHADLLTVLPPSVVTWRCEDGRVEHCAVRNAVLAVRQGNMVSIAAREAQRGATLDTLTHAVVKRFREDEEAERAARVASVRLHTQAIRKIVAALAGNHENTGLTQ